MTGYQIVLILVGLGHAVFMILEMVPWSNPYLLRRMIDKKLAGNSFTPDQNTFVANIVKNAALYNGIVAAALFWAAYTQERELARVLLTGVTAAGVFAAVTLSPAAWAQAVLGMIGIIALYLA